MKALISTVAMTAPFARTVFRARNVNGAMTARAALAVTDA